MISIIIVALFCTTKFTNGITILPDNNMNGVVFQPFKHVQFQEGSVYLTYSLNISILKYIQDQEDFISQKCPEHSIQFDKMKELWGINWKETELIVRNSDIYKINTSEIMDLHQDVRNLHLIGCGSLYKIESLFFEIEDQYKDIKKLSFDNLIKLIGLDRLKRDTKHLAMELHLNYSTPITFSNAFIRDFITVVKPSYAFHKNTIYITFDIPYFVHKLITLYTVHTKPFIYEDDFYIMKTDLKYAFMEKYLQRLYTEESYKNHCYTVSDNYYCNDNYLEKRDSCEYEYISTDERHLKEKSFNETCFKKLEKSNKITQIGKQLYFSIIKPMNIFVTNNKIDYILTLNSSAKIIEEIDYTLKTPFFEYDKNKPRYEIFESGIKENKEFVFEMKHKIKRDLGIILFILITSIIISTYIVIRVDHCYERKRNSTNLIRLHNLP